jgi:hypothetical protein
MVEIKLQPDKQQHKSIVLLHSLFTNKKSKKRAKADPKPDQPLFIDWN